jgi:hypothetical protein
MDAHEKPWLDPARPPLPPFDEAEWMQIRIFRAMTPYQRWERAMALRTMAWKLTQAGMKMRHPELTEDEIETAVRNHFARANT